MKALLTFYYIIFLAHAACAQDAAMIAIENTYRNAIVKIDVSSNTRVVVNEKNICRSEGTGFLVSHTRIVTAAHVLELDPSCGERIIIVKSRKHGVQKLGKVILAQEDVAVIETSPFDNFSMCSLVVSPTSSYETRGYRYGIPDGLEDPDPESLTIGEEHNQFSPLVRLRPVATHRGDSGGPVLEIFRVVGITKARHEIYTDLSLMIPSRVIYNILVKTGTPVTSAGDSFECNPATYEVRTRFSQIPAPPSSVSHDNDAGSAQSNSESSGQSSSGSRPLETPSPSPMFPPQAPGTSGAIGSSRDRFVTLREAHVYVRVAPEVRASGKDSEQIIRSDIVENSKMLLNQTARSRNLELFAYEVPGGLGVNEAQIYSPIPSEGLLISAIESNVKQRWWAEYISELDKKRLKKCEEGLSECGDIAPP